LRQNTLIALAAVATFGFALLGYHRYIGNTGETVPVGPEAASELALLRHANPNELAPSGLEVEAQKLGPGEMHLEVGTSGRFSLRANNVPRRRILSEMARELRFLLLDGSKLRGRATLNEKDAVLEQVLARLLHDTPYTLRYVADPSGAGALVAQLAVGWGPVPGATATPSIRYAATDSEAADEPLEARKERLRKERDARIEKRDRRRAEKGGYVNAETGEIERPPAEPPTQEQELQLANGRSERQLRRRQEALEDLETGDADARMMALLGLDPAVPGDLLLLQAALEDPHSGVRNEAVIQLGFGEGAEVGQALQLALNDTDPKIVIEAIDSLEFLNDQSAVAGLQTLLEHPNEDVRESAADALASIRF
jgi:hypothetical protein